MTYYALADLQNHGDLMATGRNCTMIEDVKAELLSYLSADHDDKELASLAKLPPKELIEMYEFELLEQPTKFEENY